MATLQQAENQILLNRQFQSFSDIQSSLSSSTNSFTSIAESLSGRLSFSNSLGEDLILPINYYNLGESFYWQNAYEATKISLYNIIQNYPIGISGSSTSNLYLQDIENANDFISTLSNYDFWLLKQLAGETVVNGMSFTASATSVLSSLSSSLSASNSNTYVLPVLNRDINNYLLFPQGVGDAVTLDNYYSDLLDENSDIDTQLNNYGAISFYEQILTTAIAFDLGFSKIYKGWTSGTGSDYFNVSSATGMDETYILPDVLLKKINRDYTFQNLVSPALFTNDYRNILTRYLNSIATVMDECKQLIDGLKYLYRNYWGRLQDRMLEGYIQELIAREWGIELFSSAQREITDNLEVRGTSLTDKQITFKFWNRILCSLVSILKSKGTIESIKRTVRAYGLPSTLIQIYELASYKSFSTGFYNESSNHAIAKFRPNIDIDPYNKVFQSVSANITSQSVSSAALSVHTKISFFDDLYIGNKEGLSGTIYSLNPNQLSLQYQFTNDNTNFSTSGYPYIQFILTSGNQTLSSDYNFVKSAINQNYGSSQGTGYWSIISGRDKGELFMQLGFVPSNYEYFDPIVNTITGSANSLSATFLSPTGVVVGSITNTPNINLGNFYLQQIGLNENHLNNLILDSDYLASPSGYSSNVLAWKFNEYVTLDVNGQNFILDSTTSGITGQPTFYGLSGNPYDYVFDDPNFFNDNVPGFKLQKMYNAKVEALIDKNLRVGISLAAPIDTFIHNMFGSRFGELYANPNDFYNYTQTDSNATYSLVDQKNNELYLAAGAQKSDVNITEFLKYLNRIGGHLGSLFQFVEQIIPVSKRILEKGIIIENPISNRFIITKTSVQERHDLEDDGTINAKLIFTGLDNKNINVPLDAEQNFIANEINSFDINFNQNLSLTGNLYDGFNNNSIVINDILNFPISGSVITNIVDFNINEKFKDASLYSQSLTAFVPTDRKNIITTIQVPQVSYIPEKVINEITQMNLQASQIDIDRLPQNDALQYQIPQHSLSGGNYFVHLNFDNTYKLLSTSLTADPNTKRFVGTIHIEDINGRRVFTNYNAVRINMGSALYNGLNAVNVIINGEYIPWNQQVKDFPINSLSGVPFEINTIGSAVDGLSLGKQVSVLFQDLMNPNDTGNALQFILDYNMEQYSSNTGVGIN